MISAQIIFRIYSYRWAYLTNFYPNHASEVFPCFNNFSIRSTFILKVNLTSESKYQVLTNTEDISMDEKIIAFKKMADISAHNFAFAILKNFSSGRSDAPNGKMYITLNVRDEMRQFTTFANQKALELMNKSRQIFGVKYPLKKLDVVAVPDYVPDEISNLGLIVLPENSLLYDESNPSILEEIKVIKSISHAIVSMWLQNIVTPLTWDQAWISEGLVKYYEYFASEDESRQSDLMDQFLIEIHQKSTLESSLGLVSKDIKVDRAASVFKMLETYSGIENFTKSVKNYVKSK